MAPKAKHFLVAKDPTSLFNLYIYALTIYRPISLGNQNHLTDGMGVCFFWLHRPQPIFGSTKPSIVLYCSYRDNIQIAFHLNNITSLLIQAARPRYERSYNLHSGLRPSLVTKQIPFQMICLLFEYCEM